MVQGADEWKVASRTVIVPAGDLDGDGRHDLFVSTPSVVWSRWAESYSDGPGTLWIVPGAAVE